MRLEYHHTLRFLNLFLVQAVHLKSENCKSDKKTWRAHLRMKKARSNRIRHSFEWFQTQIRHQWASIRHYKMTIVAFDS